MLISGSGGLPKGFHSPQFASPMQDQTVAVTNNRERSVSSSPTLRKAEWSAAMLLTAAVLYLQVIAAASAGALWRDEANTISLATLPGLVDVWKNLQYDSFPMLWILVVRFLAILVGPMNDPAFRVFGFLVGVAIVGALWLNAWTFRRSVPLLSLALLALNPSIVRFGDSMRGYGFGIVLILLTAPALWNFVQRPDPTRFIVAAIVAVASVQVLYYNAVLLLAFCAGAAAVSVSGRSWRTAGLVVVIGLIAALSLLPYRATIHDRSSWSVLVQIPDFSLWLFWNKLSDTFWPAGHWALITWLELFLLAVVYGMRAVVFPRWLNLSKQHGDAALFSAAALLVGVPGVVIFLRVLSYPTEPLYYLTLLALVAVCVDSMFGALLQSSDTQVARLALVLVIGFATFPGTLRVARTRLTNVDVIAYRLETIGRAGDVVFITPWHYGISFDRYYQGQSRWTTLPQMSDYRFHRYDLMKQKMMIGNQQSLMQPILDDAEEALRTGHKVFVVGELKFPPMGQQPILLPAAPLTGSTWPLTTYYNEWSSMLGFFLQQHADVIAPIPVHTYKAVSKYEYLHLFSATGWKR
jgi:hypothetical protein